VRQGVPRAHRRHRARHRDGLRAHRHRARRRRDGRAPGPSRRERLRRRGAATGIVEAGAVLGAERVRSGDVVLALASSGRTPTGTRSSVTSSVAPASPTRRRPRTSVARGARSSSSRPASTRSAPASARRDPGASTRSATSRAAASPRTSPACCRRARGSTSIVHVVAGTRLPRARRPRRTRAGEHRGHVEPRHRVLRRRRRRPGGCRDRGPPRGGHRHVAGRGRAHRRGSEDGHGDFEQGAKGVDGGAVRLVGSYSTAN
jgi:phosphoribosylformylglycinamidine cyclo-ligase